MRDAVQAATEAKDRKELEGRWELLWAVRASSGTGRMRGELTWIT